MDFSHIHEQINKAKSRIEKVRIPKEKAKEIIVALDANVSNNTHVGPLNKEKFKEITEDYDITDVEDLEVGNFVRYKFMNAEKVIKYVWGGILTFKGPNFLRLKNIKSNVSWTMYYDKPGHRYVFYEKKKRLEKNGRYVNLNNASTEGLLAEIIGRGSHEELEHAAKLARKRFVDERLGR
ncbi:hypothetical protein ATCV1_Z017L [Acanthocystis turfacea chlorella virus 1]|uniref:Uncharacterized protein Z017L n=1 Tax=Chlorovirus heliozoae TaxID=322019 RepID=A7K7X7_9PHYC|nr:hypothetical protein ATCV1_Z017L [Acanthocystis turfacea chlorella virus 1]ABT16151.1 hypothetical protein ATCV1_Z017L [Acanthocystis turfacea chlorella virus 1]